MKVFAISDPHLSFSQPKPMDIFGKDWENYETRLAENWKNTVGQEDLVLIAGDVSWAMAFENAMKDLEWLASLPGKKVLLRGNHDYWWKSITAMRSAFPQSIFAVQNDCLRFGRVIVCGTRGWTVPELGGSPSPEDSKIFARECERLKLTLSAAEKERKSEDIAIVMMHYPPFNARFAPSAFTQQIGAFHPDAVVYGHLHGKTGRNAQTVTLDGVPYYLTSLDKIGAQPLLIAEDK